MKTSVKSVAYALAAVLSLSIVVGSVKLGTFGVDVVSAATEGTAPSKQTEAKTSTAPKTQTTYQTATKITRLLAFGSYGGDVKLLQTMLNNNGYKLKVDGIFGKKTLAAVKDYQSKNGLAVDGIVGPKTLAKLNPATTTPAKPTTPDVVTSEKTTIKIGKVEYAAHGTKCFTVAVAAVAGDKIVAAFIDDYQFMSKDVAVGVPNSDKDFGANYKDPNIVLASKRTNTGYYSNNMKEKAGATTPIDKSFDAIQAYVKGKTIAELEGTLSTTTKEQMVDAVSGATLADTQGYVSAIVAAAKAAKENSSIQVDTAALDNLKIGKVEYAAHGTKCFTVAVAAVAGDKIVAAFIDDYQFMSKDVAVGVPNSDKDFGANYKDPNIVLASKRTNTGYYSNNMKEKAGATTPIDKSFDAIQAYVKGKTIAELEGTLSTTTKEQMVDAVSGATLADTQGYVSAIVAAAKAAK